MVVSFLSHKKPFISPLSGAILSAMLMVGATAYAGSVYAQENIPTIEVSATASQSAVPDLAIVHLGVVNLAESAQKALSANSETMARVTNLLKSMEIEGKDLQTSNFSVQPQYHHFKKSSSGVTKPPKIVAYRVSNNLDVRVRNIKKLGQILDLAINLGINSTGGISFTNADPEPIITKARRKAMEKAIEKAATLTQAAGAKLGKILLISEGVTNKRPIRLARARAFEDSAANPVPIEAGENRYSVRVQVKWAIEQ